MSAHFEPGEYKIVQGGREVGRLIARDLPAVVEHWFLYHGVPASAEYATYTAPGDGSFGTVFQTATSVEWTIAYVGTGAGISDLDQYAAQRASATGGSVYRINAPSIVFAANVPAGDFESPAAGDTDNQIFGGGYSLRDKYGVEVGGVDVTTISTLTEAWQLYGQDVSQGGTDVAHRYTAPSSANGGRDNEARFTIVHLNGSSFTPNPSVTSITTFAVTPDRPV